MQMNAFFAEKNLQNVLQDIFCNFSPHNNIFFLFFRLGNDRYKTKPIYETLNPKWLEQFDLDLIEGGSQELEISIWDKDKGKNYWLFSVPKILIFEKH